MGVSSVTQSLGIPVLVRRRVVALSKQGGGALVGGWKTILSGSNGANKNHPAKCRVVFG